MLVGCARATRRRRQPAASPARTVTGHHRSPFRPARRRRARSAIRSARIDRARRSRVRGRPARNSIAGRLVAAREHFDARRRHAAELPDGARANPRLPGAFDRLLDRISALDVLALRDGDGFTEARSEPAAIDELLNAAHVRAAAAGGDDRRDGARRPRSARRTTSPIPLNAKVLSYVELFQGRLHEFMEAGLDRGAALSADDSARLQGRGPAARSGLRAAGRERVQDQRAVARQRARHVAVHAAGTGKEHGLEQNWFVDERSDPGEGDARGRAVPEDAARHVRRRLEPRARQLQRRAGPAAARRQARRRSTDFWKITADARVTCRARPASTCR